MSVPQNIQELANKVRNEIYGRDVRESIAKSMEATGEVAEWSRQVAQDIVDGKFDEGELATEIERKLNELEVEYTPRLNSVETDLAQTEMDVLNRGINVLSPPIPYVALKGDGVTDDTNAFNNIIKNAVEGTKVIFPKRAYKGNFHSNKSLDIDFMGSTIISGDGAPIKFTGEIGSPKTVTEYPTYGNTSFTVDNIDGLEADMVGYLIDESARPSDSKLVNAELVKIKRVDASNNTVYVYDMVRSTMTTGIVSFYPITKSIKNPSITNVNIQVENSNLYPGIWFFGCEEPYSDNITVNNSTGHAVRHEYCYNWTSENIRVMKPSKVGSGQGYGVTAINSRIGLARNIYGVGTRHLIDFDSSYLCYSERVVEDDAQHTGVVVLSHNGFGGSCGVHDLVCRVDGYAVHWADQGFDANNKSKQVIRDLSVTKVQHIIPTLTSESFISTVNIRHDYANLTVENIEAKYINESVSPTVESTVVRLYGNVRGITSIKNISANLAGSLIMAQIRELQSGYHPHLIMDNLVIGTSIYPVFLRGITSAEVDNILVSKSCTSVVRLESYLNSIPFRFSYGSQLNIAQGEIISTVGITATGLRGTPPKLSEGSATGYDVNPTGTTITQEKILNSGGFLRVFTPTNSDANLNATVPFEPPIWAGQELNIVVVNIGYVGNRGNLIIPANTNTYASTTITTLEKGNIYRLVGYEGKWRMVS